MKESIEQVIRDAACGFADRRVCLFDVQLESIDANVAVLSGRVLERANVESLRRALVEKLPAIRIDDSAVRVLKTQSPPAVRTVATNLTDLHREPSFLSELMTQVLNGRRLEVLEERDRWCYVRQPEDGYLGWVYKPYLTDEPPGRATHMISVAAPAVYAEKSNPPEALTRLLAGTRVELLRQEHDCAYVRTVGEMLPRGWVPRQFLRPLDSLPLPPADARRQMISDALTFRGVYYLWGGCTAFGIDCSGLCQLVHRLAGYEIPRDADMQFAAGQVVDGPPFRAGHLLFFGGEQGASDKRKVTHVGLALGAGWRMIHSSRGRNGVYEDDVEKTEHLRTTFAGARSFLPPD